MTEEHEKQLRELANKVAQAYTNAYQNGTENKTNECINELVKFVNDIYPNPDVVFVPDLIELKKRESHIVTPDDNYFTELPAILDCVKNQPELNKPYLQKSLENTINRGYFLIRQPESIH